MSATVAELAESWGERIPSRTQRPAAEMKGWMPSSIGRVAVRLRRLGRRNLGVLSVFVLLHPGGRAHGELLPEQVCLIWNSYSPSSVAIRNAYVAARPGVRELDLSLPYASSVLGRADGDLRVTELFITPEEFDRKIRPLVLEFIYDDALDVRCFVTTRGVPVLVTNQFNPPLGHGQTNGVVASFEGALSVIGIVGAQALSEVGMIQNPYFARVGEEFGGFLRDQCIERRIFLTSRLDAHASNESNTVQAIKEMIARSLELRVNKFGTTIVMDDVASGCFTIARTRFVMKLMRSHRWPVFYDGGDAFLHGATLVSGTADCPCPAKCESLTVEENYIGFPELVHAGLGRTHTTACGGGANRECVSRGYVSQYVAHSAGMFFSAESFNGVSLWRSPGSHGNALRWISDAKGSFAFAHVYGPSTGTAAESDFAMLNFYVHGLSWAEAACSSMPLVGYVVTAIGDPLARVVVQDADLDGNGVVDQEDLQILINWMLQGSPTEAGRLLADIDQDGLVDQADMSLLLSVMNRPLPNDLNNPIPDSPVFITPQPSWVLFSGLERPLRCRGDVNGDFTVDRVDEDMVTQAVPCNSLAMDVNADGVVDEHDVAIASNHRTTEQLLDADQNGILNCTDLFTVYQQFCNSGCNEQHDLNCNGSVGFDDVELLKRHLVDLSGVQSFQALDYNQSGSLDCGDLQILRDQYAPYASQPAIQPEFDLNGDGLVSCEDEWLFEWLLLSLNQPICPGLGCGECLPVCLPVNPDCPADIMPENEDGTVGDGRVSIQDLTMLLMSMGACPNVPEQPCPGDLDGDCNVSMADVIILLVNFEQDCL